MSKIEILAPAGSIEGLYAALKMGADAVYTGTARFSARAYADNPSIEELEQALTYAHLHDKKIYLTVNTLLNDREIEEELFPMIRPLYEAGLDACIVQDLGVMSFLHENFPDMDLHASTQMTLFSGDEANLYRRYGVTRYVPARELTIEEIRAARTQTDMEIEVFVHGALCYCYSGQCLMSSVIGGRSGNRGTCAQPCRFLWQSEQGKGYYLSTKDTCTLMYIPELIEAGIDSFKIEGRMKKKAYSAFLSHIYRKYADLYEERGGVYFEELKENKDSILWQDYKKSQDIYNRGGFSDSFLFEKEKANMIYPKKNGHYGTLAGKVICSTKKTVDFMAEERLHYQDILEFRGRNDEKMYEYTVKNEAQRGECVTANILPGIPLYAGQKIYRTRNAALLGMIEKEIEEKEDKIPLFGFFEGKCGEPVRLTIKGKGQTVTAEGAIAQRASGRPVQKEDIRRRLDSLGNTNYVFSSLDIQCEEQLFIPLGSLKELRRRAIAEWEKKAVKHRKALERAAAFLENGKRKEKPEKNKTVFVSVASVEQLKEVRKRAKEDVIIHIKLEDFPEEDWNTAAKMLEGRQVALSLPRVLRSKGLSSFMEQWNKSADGFRRLSPAAILINSHRALLLAKEWWQDVPWYADENLYMENRWAKRAYREEYGILPPPKRIYGRIPVMVTENCLMKTRGRCGTGHGRIGLTGPKGDAFTVVSHCRYCYNTIYTKEPVTEGDSSFLWENGGVSEEAVRYDFTWEDAAQVREVMQKWKE